MEELNDPPVQVPRDLVAEDHQHGRVTCINDSHPFACLHVASHWIVALQIREYADAPVFSSPFRERSVRPASRKFFEGARLQAAEKLISEVSS
jgi:hypothetical protein